MFQFQGTWSSSTSYVVDDIVTYNNINYICIKDNTNKTPILSYNSRVDTAFWDIFQEGGMSHKSQWTDATTYYPGDLVLYRHSTYLCKKKHTSSVNNVDPFYNPRNEWELFLQGDAEEVPWRRVKMLMNKGPIGWNGNPYTTKPNWGTANSWNGNIPFNISSTYKRWEWANINGHARGVSYNSISIVGGDGKLYNKGYSTSYDANPPNNYVCTAYLSDPSWMKDYWNNENRTGGLKGYDWKKDNTAGMPTVVQTMTGYGTRMALLSNGTVVKYGGGPAGQNTFANSNDDTSSGAVQIPFPPGTFIVKIASSAVGTDSVNPTLLALDSEGYVWSWGNNYYGGLGLGNEVSQGVVIGMLNDARSDGSTTGSYRDYETIPKRIPRFAFGGYRVVDIWATGRYYSSCYALTEAGVLYSWGYNGYGQLGYPTNSGFRHTDSSTVPLVFGRSSGINWNSYGGIQKIMFTNESDNNGGYHCVYILDGQGYLWWCGYNAGYSVGDNSTTSSTGNSGNPIRITLSTAGGAPNLNGNVVNFWVCGNGGYNPTIYAMHSNGNLYGWGYNGYYELTDGTITARNYPVVINGVTNVLNMMSVSVSNYPGTLALTVDGSGRYRIWQGGANNRGFGGRGDTGGTHATGGDHVTPAFQKPYGYGQYYWANMYMPAGSNRTIRDFDVYGYGTYLSALILMDDGTLFGTGYAPYSIDPWSGGNANIMKKVHGIY